MRRTPEQILAARKSQLDCRCEDCGWTSALTGWCPKCKSVNLEFRTHAETPDGERLWCGNSNPKNLRKKVTV